MCFRLYDEDDFDRRPPHTDPEILRSSLAGVILRMKSLRLGEVEDFPFIDAPQAKMIADGYQLLAELGAVDDALVTDRGRPRFCQAAARPEDRSHDHRCRERGCPARCSSSPARCRPRMHASVRRSARAPRTRAHARFRGGEIDQKSEFLWFLHAWRAWDEVLRHETGSKAKAWCRQNFMSWLRLREWRDVHTQLHSLCAEHGWKENQQPASYEAIHKALLSGLLGQRRLQGRGCLRAAGRRLPGARGIKFWPHPGSTLARKAGKWIVCANWWIPRACSAAASPASSRRARGGGAHLVKRHVFEPHWEKGQERCVPQSAPRCTASCSARRSVGYRDVDPALCREIFIRSALVEGEIAEGPARGMAFFHNRRPWPRSRLEHKSRRPDVLVDEPYTIEAFYESRIPAEVVDLASF